MTVQTLYTAATGMQALETKLDVIANNMANINTTAFKKDRANFEDLFYRQYRLPGAEDVDGNRTSTGIEVGLGVRVGSTQTELRARRVRDHEQPARPGHRRRRVLPDRRSRTATSSTRGPATSASTPTGRWCSARPYNGYLESSGITIPPEATGIVISTDGQVQIQHAGLADAAKHRPDCNWRSSSTPTACLKLGDNLVPGDRCLGHGADRHARASRASARFGRASWKRRTSSR